MATRKKKRQKDGRKKVRKKVIISNTRAIKSYEKIGKMTIFDVCDDFALASLPELILYHLSDDIKLIMLLRNLVSSSYVEVEGSTSRIPVLLKHSSGGPRGDRQNAAIIKEIDKIFGQLL